MSSERAENDREALPSSGTSENDDYGNSELRTNVAQVIRRGAALDAAIASLLAAQRSLLLRKWLPQPSVATDLHEQFPLRSLPTTRGSDETPLRCAQPPLLASDAAAQTEVVVHDEAPTGKCDEALEAHRRFLSAQLRGLATDPEPPGETLVFLGEVRAALSKSSLPNDAARREEPVASAEAVVGTELALPIDGTSAAGTFSKPERGNLHDTEEAGNASSFPVGGDAPADDRDPDPTVGEVPDAASSHTQHAHGASPPRGIGIDWEDQALRALDAGEWRAARDKKGRKFYFNRADRTSCWNLVKELERRHMAKASGEPTATSK